MLLACRICSSVNFGIAIRLAEPTKTQPLYCGLYPLLNSDGAYLCGSDAIVFRLFRLGTIFPPSLNDMDASILHF